METSHGISDKEIRKLRAWALEHCHDNNKPEQYAEYVKGSHAMYSADVALGNRRARSGDSRDRARARCAEFLETRRQEIK